MPKLENFATHIKINGNPFAKNAINYQVQSGDTVSIYYSNDRDMRIVKGLIARFDDWTDLNNVAYSSFTQLTDDLDLFLFESSGVISLGNSSTTPLADGAVFTGTGDDVTNYATVSVQYNSDVAAAASGLKMEFSTDNSNWDTSLIGDLGAKTFQVHRLTVGTKYFRVVYTNGSAAQGHFRLQVIYHTDSAPVLITRAGQPQSTVDATPTRLTTDIDLDFARRHIPGGRSFFFFGHNNALQNGVFEDVWAGGGDINWQTVGAKVKAVSTNAADTAAGLGLQSIELHGLSPTGVDQDEVLALDGTTPVESALTYIRVSLSHNEEVGTYGGSHQGDIEVRVTNAVFANGELLAKMEGIEGAVDSSVQYGYGEAQNGFTSVPLGKVLYITRLEVIPKANKAIDVILYERDGLLTIADPFQPRRIIWSAEELETPVEKEFKSHIKIKSLADLFFRAQGTGGVSGVDVELDYYLVDADASGA